MRKCIVEWISHQYVHFTLKILLFHMHFCSSLFASLRERGTDHLPIDEWSFSSYINFSGFPTELKGEVKIGLSKKDSRKNENIQYLIIHCIFVLSRSQIRSIKLNVCISFQIFLALSLGWDRIFLLNKNHQRWWTVEILKRSRRAPWAMLHHSNQSSKAFSRTSTMCHGFKPRDRLWRWWSFTSVGKKSGKWKGEITNEILLVHLFSKIIFKRFSFSTFRIREDEVDKRRKELKSDKAVNRTYLKPIADDRYLYTKY